MLLSMTDAAKDQRGWFGGAIEGAPSVKSSSYTAKFTLEEDNMLEPVCAFVGASRRSAHTGRNRALPR